MGAKCSIGATTFLSLPIVADYDAVVRNKTLAAATVFVLKSIRNHASDSQKGVAGILCFLNDCKSTKMSFHVVRTRLILPLTFLMITRSRRLVLGLDQ